MQRLLAWAQRNERHLGGVVFVLGFATDIITFTLLDVSVVNLFFIGYLSLAAVCTFGSHLLFARRQLGQSKIERGLSVLFTLVSQYAIGGILSGCLIFYTKSAVLSVSWPFIALIALVFLGNEYFRKYREHLIFQTALLFFALYAYSIFALPIYVNRLGLWVFVGSTVLALLIFSLFLYALHKASRDRFRENRTPIIASMLVTVVVVTGTYVTGVIPPIPLTLKDKGIYHGLVREGGQYAVQAEQERPWWDIRTPLYHFAPGETAYAYAAVFAPTRFTTQVVHHWEIHENGKWRDRGRLPYSISGGRVEGYRGYSKRSTIEPGKWRVTVETLEGQVIGRIRFDVERVEAPPPLNKEVR